MEPKESLWDDVADYLNERTTADQRECCFWCLLVGNASGGPTDKERLDVIEAHWTVLDGSPFAGALRDFAESLDC